MAEQDTRTPGVTIRIRKGAGYEMSDETAAALEQLARVVAEIGDAESEVSGFAQSLDLGPLQTSFKTPGRSSVIEICGGNDIWGEGCRIVYLEF